MDSLQVFLTKNGSSDIHTIGRYIEQHINKNWLTIFERDRGEIIALFQKIGDSAYGLYGQRLFQHIHNEFKTLGLRATPKLPGSLMISREWGPEDDRQRWMWSKITSADGKALGTIVTVFYHDHFQIRIPRAFRVIALDVTSRGDVIKALSQLAPEFKDALDMKAEIAAYMAQAGENSLS